MLIGGMVVTFELLTVTLPEIDALRPLCLVPAGAVADGIAGAADVLCGLHGRLRRGLDDGHGPLLLEGQAVHAITPGG